MKHDPRADGYCRVCQKWAKRGERCHGRRLRKAEREAVAKWYPSAWWLSGKIKRKQNADFEDDAQEAAVQMCQSARTFDAGRGVSIGTHLVNGAQWKIIESYRRRLTHGFGGLMNFVHSGREIPAPEVLVSDDEQIGREPEDSGGELVEVIGRALAKLDERTRYVVVERIWAGRALASIAVDLEVCKERVMQIFDDGLDMLRLPLSGVAADHGFGGV